MNNLRSDLYSESEKIPLFNFSKRGKEYGTSSTSLENKNYNYESEPKKISFFTLFRYATKRDKFFIFIGSICAIIHGAGFPVLAIFFGKMTDVFIRYAKFGPSNNSTINTLYNNLSEINTQNITQFEKNYISQEEFFNLITRYSLNLAYLCIVVFFSSLIQAVCWEWACERQIYRLRQEFFFQVLRQEISWFDHHQTGDLSMKLSDDLERIREGIGHKFSMLFQFITTFITGFGVGFLVSWQLTLVVLSLTPLLSLTSAFTGKLIATQSAREQKKYGKAGGIANEVLSSIKTVASFCGEKNEIKRYEKSLIEGMRMSINKYHFFSIGLGLVNIILYSSYALAFWYSCLLLERGQISPGSVFTIFFSVLIAAFSVGNAIPFVSIVSIAKGAGAVVFEIIENKPNIDPYNKHGLMPIKVTGLIQFKNVSFSYPSRKSVQILRDFSLEIKPGKTIAIVGLSGSGKSTIVNLLLRFYDPDAGQILVDGIDIKLFNLAWLRTNLGVVLQEPTLFGVSIYENIRYGRDDVTPNEIINGTEMSNAHEFITKFPQGYDTLTGERGSRLSVGQTQRICIARALVRDPKILLMDESTSSLDSKSEYLIQQALENKIKKGRTTIIIAHRLSTIKNADVIYVLNDGKIAEFGTHSHLLDQEKIYFELIMSQITHSDNYDEFSAGSTTYESADEFSSIENYKYDSKRKRAKKYKKIKRITMPDPDKKRLKNEVAELGAIFPGTWQVLKLNKPEWSILLMGAVGCLAVAAVMPMFAVFYSEMFRTFTLSGEELEKASLFWSLMFIVLAIVSGIGFWARTIFVATAGEYLTMRLRLLSFIGIVRQHIGWFDKEANSASRLATRLARDIPLVKAASGHRVAILITAFVTTTLGISIAFYYGWQLALVILAGFPILVIAGYIQIQIQKGGQKKDAALMEEVCQIANEAIGNIRTVQSLCQERIFLANYLDHLFPVYVEAHKQALVYGFAFAFSEAILFLIYAVSFYYGGWLVENKAMAPIEVFRVFFSITFCAISVGQTTSFIPDYTKANLAAALTFNLIELKSEIDPLDHAGLMPKIHGRITFNNVSFQYPNRENVKVLNGLSFDLQSGKSLALIGRSGVGKSTIVGLIERFYDATSGTVLIDGVDIRSINVSHLRKNIGYISQEPTLFQCSIRDNIAYGYYGEEPVTEDLIFEAAKAANIHNFIVNLPMGYDTYVGERGIQLSGGEKQRICIARALIKNPKLLILDEATSSLDTESEKNVQETIEKAKTGRTCLIIAHRLSTICGADCIAVINKGKVVEKGNHEELMQRKGIYYKLTKRQRISH